VRRRRLHGMLLGASVAVLPFARPVAQSKPRLRIGTVSDGGRDDRVTGYAALFERLAELGYVEGRNLDVDFVTFSVVSVGDAFNRVVRRGADLLFVAGDEFKLLAARTAAAGRVPVVFVALDYDPVRIGYIASLARPGGNLTGLYTREPELAAKRVELAHDALPNMRQLALWSSPVSLEQVEAAEKVARSLSLETRRVDMNGNPGQEYDSQFKMISDWGRAAMIVPSSSTMRADRAAVCRLALEKGIPLIAPQRDFVEAGALLSYGANRDAAYRDAATYIDRIARGEKPADLPVEQPTKFELVINLSTAKALGLTVPPLILARADELIE
jgi:ABC-type uncharacterized transport system substrate-binding protein